MKLLYPDLSIGTFFRWGSSMPLYVKESERDAIKIRGAASPLRVRVGSHDLETEVHPAEIYDPRETS